MTKAVEHCNKLRSLYKPTFQPCMNQHFSHAFQPCSQTLLNSTLKFNANFLIFNAAHDVVFTHSMTELKNYYKLNFRQARCIYHEL